MSRFSKASSALFFASVMGAHIASAHKLPKGTDTKKFGAELKQLRTSQGKKGKGGGKSSDIPLPTGTTAETFLDGFEFIGPTGPNQRGPCPFINTMANHGLLNRDGKDIPAFNIPLVGSMLFDLPEEMFLPVVNMVIFDGQAVVQPDGLPLLDIVDLWGRPGEERDVSQVFPNPGLMLEPEAREEELQNGFEAGNFEYFTDFRYAIDTEVLNSLLSKADGDVLTQDHHNEHLRDRIIDSREHDTFFVFSEEQKANAAAQYVLPCLILGEDSEDFTFCSAEDIRVLWTEFRFPDGYAPRSVRFGLDSFDIAAYQQFLLDQADVNKETAIDAWLEELPEATPTALSADTQQLRMAEKVKISIA